MKGTGMRAGTRVGWLGGRARGGSLMNSRQGMSAWDMLGLVGWDWV